MKTTIIVTVCILKLVALSVVTNLDGSEVLKTSVLLHCVQSRLSKCVECWLLVCSQGYLNVWSVGCWCAVKVI